MGLEPELYRPDANPGRLCESTCKPRKQLWTKARWHDVYPKPDLDGGYLGDRYPVCADLPAGYFLNRGALSLSLSL